MKIRERDLNHQKDQQHDLNQIEYRILVVEHK
jgi:hypothetical protein